MVLRGQPQLVDFCFSTMHVLLCVPAVGLLLGKSGLQQFVGAARSAPQTAFQVADSTDNQVSSATMAAADLLLDHQISSATMAAADLLLDDQTASTTMAAADSLLRANKPARKKKTSPNNGNQARQTVCTTTQKCASMIRSLLPTGVAAESISWAFIGSSTMSRTFEQVRRIHGVDRRWPGHRHRSSRCDLHKFLNVKLLPAANWSLPDLGKEGPHVFGLEHPGCHDCSHCHGWRSGETRPSVEYIPIEFARDVEYQTKSTRTTQETASLYLARRPRDICVVSAGIHDISIPQITDKQFFLNVGFYLQQLRRGCVRIVWVTMSCTESNPKYPQKDDRIRRWNEELLRHDFPEIAVVVDVYPMSTTFSHEDNLHLEKKYYAELAKAFPV